MRPATVEAVACEQTPSRIDRLTKRHAGQWARPIAPPRESAAVRLIYSNTSSPTRAFRQEHALESIDTAERIADLLSDRQAEDIVLMDISKVSSFTDYFVIATVNNARQMNALIDSLDGDLRDDGIRPLRSEGAADSGWVLVDFGDAIVHLFGREERQYYNLEALWSQGVSAIHIQ